MTAVNILDRIFQQLLTVGDMKQLIKKYLLSQRNGLLVRKRSGIMCNISKMELLLTKQI